MSVQMEPLQPPSGERSADRDLEAENASGSLAATPHDEALLEWHLTGQLALVNVANRQVEKVGAPAMIWDFDFSPNGEFVRVTKLDKPFSYIVPVSSFGRTEEIWDRSGSKLVEFNKTDQIFTQPERRQTQDYITGRFG